MPERTTQPQIATRFRKRARLQELSARGLITSGLKADLIARLRGALEAVSSHPLMQNISSRAFAHPVPSCKALGWQDAATQSASAERDADAMVTEPEENEPAPEPEPAAAPPKPEASPPKPAAVEPEPVAEPAKAEAVSPAAKRKAEDVAPSSAVASAEPARDEGKSGAPASLATAASPCPRKLSTLTPTMCTEGESPQTSKRQRKWAGDAEQPDSAPQRTVLVRACSRTLSCIQVCMCAGKVGVVGHDRAGPDQGRLQVQSQTRR